MNTQQPTQASLPSGPTAPQVRPSPAHIQPQVTTPIPGAPVVTSTPMPIQTQPAPMPMAQPAIGQPMPAPSVQPMPVNPAPNVPAMPPMPQQAVPGGVQPAQAPQMTPNVAPTMPAQAAPIPSQPAQVPAEAASEYQAPPADRLKEGGERALPSISIQAFCDRSETASVINEMSRDWRMKRTNMKIYMGGLPAAIEFYQKESTPGLILVESGMRGSELFAQLEQLASVCDEGTQLIMIGAANDIKLYRQLIDQGVSDYIVPPFHPLTLIRSIADKYSDPEKPFTGRVAAFFGAKGGVGSSTLAHNVAWCLAEGVQQETALIDLDASWGTTGLDFAYDATEGLEEALAQPDRLDETLLDRIMLRHTSKLSILPASCSLGQKPNMSTVAYETVVNEVRSISPMAILDMPHFWCEWTTNVLTNADDVVITAAPDLANLRNAKNLIDFLRAERPNDAEPILILNKMGTSKNNEISVKDFGAAVGIDPALVIGFDPETFIEAANDGKMLTDVKTAAQTVTGLMYIAQRLKTGSFPIETGNKSKGLSFGGSKRGASGGKTSLLSKLKKRS